MLDSVLEAEETAAFVLFSNILTDGNGNTEDDVFFRCGVVAVEAAVVVTVMLGVLELILGLGDTVVLFLKLGN